jgi:hypothetical protein
MQTRRLDLRLQLEERQLVRLEQVEPLEPLEVVVELLEVSKRQILLVVGH